MATNTDRTEAVRKVLHDETGGCVCTPSYTDRGREAPDCWWHDIQRAIPDVLSAAGVPALPSRDEVLALIPLLHSPMRVQSWPHDEQEMFRRPWGSYTERAEALDAYRREKVADAVLALLRTGGTSPVGPHTSPV